MSPLAPVSVGPTQDVLFQTDVRDADGNSVPSLLLWSSDNTEVVALSVRPDSLSALGITAKAGTAFIVVTAPNGVTETATIVKSVTGDVSVIGLTATAVPKIV